MRAFLQVLQRSNAHQRGEEPGEPHGQDFAAQLPTFFFFLKSGWQWGNEAFKGLAYTLDDGAICF